MTDLSSSDEAAADTPAPEAEPNTHLPTTTFDLLRQRLAAVAGRLGEAANALNGERAEVFASVPLTLGEQDRLHTEHPTVPRDAVCVGELLLVGFNAGGSLGRNRSVGGTFALYRVNQVGASDWDFVPVPTTDPAWFLGDQSFQRDVGELFTYYADTRLESMVVADGRLLMVFRTGSAAEDLRVLRWQVGGDAPRYVDAYGDHDLTTADAYDFGWTDADRVLLAEGRWPHWRIDGVHLGIAKGGLELRIDDVVEGGRTILRETVAEPTQSVDELRIRFAELGDVLVLGVQPYREQVERFYVFNRLTRAAHRADAIGRNCHQLPEGQGIVFPGGYHLANGENKVFATDSSGFRFHAAHRAPNGEDIGYVYFRAATGEYLLCTYNVVRRAMETPVVLHGYGLFPDGVLVGIRAAAEAQRVHTIAVYTSPFCSPDHYEPAVAGDSFFGRVGNPELVRVIGETLSLGRDAREPAFNQAVFEALVARATTLIDTYGWLSAPESHGLGGLLVELRRTAGDVLDEFANAVAQRKEAADRLADGTRLVTDLSAEAELELRDADAFITRLAAVRSALGHLSELTEVRQIDLAAVAELRDRTVAIHDALAGRAIEFLDSPDALAGVHASFDAASRSAADAPTAAAVAVLATEVDTTGDRLVLLTEVVGGLQVTDPTGKTAVLGRLADALARRNAVRAELDARTAVLRTSESAAGFGASMAVLAQRATAALTAAADAAGCDAALASLVAELENAELAYGEVPAFAEQIAVRRDELSNAFSQRRDALAAERTARIDRLAASAARVMATVVSRASALPGRPEIDAFFATDPLVTKVRSTTDELRGLGEAGRAGELEVALGAARDQARRAATDRAELFDAGTVKIGRWKFGTNREPFELRLEADADGAFRVRLTGTELALPCRDEALAGLAGLARQTHPSETPTMPRALYLAFEAARAGIPSDGVTAFANGRIEDGFEPGVHDADARRILTATGAFWTSPALFIDGTVRAVAGVWLHGLARTDHTNIERRLHAVRALGTASGDPGTTGAGTNRSRGALIEEHAEAIRSVAAGAGLTVDPSMVVDYLAGSGEDRAIGATAATRADDLRGWAADCGIDLRSATFGELVHWLADRNPGDPLGVAAEAAWSLIDPSVRAIPDVHAVVTVDGLISTHPAISAGQLTIDVAAAYTGYLAYRLHGGLERFRGFTATRRSVLDRERARLEVDRLRPQVISSFVRNRLIDEVYLPLIGDNIARQLGLNGAAQGLLLLISPPGYGKTTLIEYVADLLGFALVKVNGPALGDEVTSLDPAAAPNAAAAEELAKLNRAFAMGTNVVCYLDDIQHTSPALLQKFIPLCDATRRIEGVIDGIGEDGGARTFDLSGKRFVMVMAGNPYTSAGAAFRIPDMLANRADVHNLGDVAASAADAFAQSYVENACGVNEVLAPVLGRSREDLAALLRAATTAEPLRSDQLRHPYGASELQAVLKTLGHLVRVREQLLKVNAAYIASATMDDHLRGEPAFLLQGSYRNMARIAQRIVPAMTTAEVDTAVAEHYRAESQTLAAAAAWNLAKLDHVLGRPDADGTLDAMRRRWKEANVAGDPMAVMANALREIATTLHQNLA